MSATSELPEPVYLEEKLKEIQATGRLKYRSKALPTWCPGCGYFSMTEGVASAMNTDEGRRQAQTLITDATNDALRAAERVIQQETQRMARELGIEDMPGMDKLAGMLGS